MNNLYNFNPVGLAEPFRPGMRNADAIVEYISIPVGLADPFRPRIFSVAWEAELYNIFLEVPFWGEFWATKSWQKKLVRGSSRFWGLPRGYARRARHSHEMRNELYKLNKTRGKLAKDR
jgi:hypothetical protein